MKINQKQVMFALTGFLVTWQATGFDLDYRSILSSIIASGVAGASPKKAPKAQILLRGKGRSRKGRPSFFVP